LTGLPGRFRPDRAPCMTFPNASRIASTLRRLTPRSQYPFRDAERTWITPAASSIRNSTSSTNPNRDRNSARIPLCEESTTTARGRERTTHSITFRASAAVPRKGIGSTRREGSGSRLDTQLGDEGQGRRSESPAAEARRDMPGSRRKISKVRMVILQHAFLPATNGGVRLGSSGSVVPMVPPRRGIIPM
jgi:hypothetical protein